MNTRPTVGDRAKMNGLRSLLAVLLLVVCPSFSLAKLQSGNFHVNLTFQANTLPVSLEFQTYGTVC